MCIRSSGGSHLRPFPLLFNEPPSVSVQYFQPAIDHIVIAMQRRHNVKFPIIFNTYQCYLKDSKSRLELDLARARKEKFWFAAKLVRASGHFSVMSLMHVLSRRVLSQSIDGFLAHAHFSLHR
jgi:hypothetical protein